MTPRQALAAAALAAIVATRVEPALFTLPFADRTEGARAYALLPDSQWPQYPRFLEGVRAHTQPGDTIAIVVPAAAPRESYPYAYYRASYFLTGREVLPLLDPRTAESLAQNLLAARYIAAFGESPPPAAEVVWRGEGGTLYRR